ncbi:VIT domain-containing protein [Flavobacterium sp.]|uniref:VIT domain-containing protein n=1 Tax=Flavobacterium sp. TaxID=239 RepID=UPI00391D1C49
MKNSLLFLFVLIGTLVHAQNPQLTVKGKDSSLVRMTQMKVSVKVVGNIAYSTSEMHFFNGSNRQMEAELLFPLPEGVSVSRYAIDINGKMREAVPVNKNKGKQVFEAIEHRRVDPGLLEKVEGNNFRTRIYPLMPGKSRIVIIGYEQELSNIDATHLGYQMVSSVAHELDVFELNISIVGATERPTVTTDEGTLALENMNQNYRASIKRNQYKPKDKLLITIPIRTEMPSVVVQTKDNQHFFYANTIIDGGKILKKNPTTIGLIWDNSLSCRKRDLKKELELLDAYFRGLHNVEVTLYFSGYNFEKKAVFSVKNGDWETLKNVLKATKYDGGTRYSKIKLPLHDEYLFFTDGLSSLSANTLAATRKPMYTITSLASSDYAFLNYYAVKTGGAFVNLNDLNVEEALSKMVFQTMKFLGVKDNYMVIEMYPMIGTPVSGSFSMCGISLKDKQEVTLLFGYDEKPILEKTITVEAQQQADNEVSIEKLWAQKKIANLGLQYKQNAEEIETLGKKYGIVTENTSLIVLENLHDYIQYDIVPPAELRPEFDRLLKQQIANAQAKKYSNWENVANYYETLLAWWNKDVKFSPPKPIPAPKKSSRQNGNISGIISDSTGPLPGANIAVKGTNRNTQTDFDGKYSINANRGETLVVSFVGYENSEVRIGNSATYNVRMRDNVRLEEVVVQGYRMNDNSDKEEVEDDLVKEKRSVVSNSTTVVTARSIESRPNANIIQSLEGKVPGLNITGGSHSLDNNKGFLNDKNIKLTQWSPDRVYLKALAVAPVDKKYDLYLDLREGQETNPSFYFDVANYFYDNGNKSMALLVLSNIADLSLENHQLYKSLTYLLRQWEAYEDALYTATQVAKWRIHEPQAHRDLALTLEDNKQYQAAFDELIKGLEVSYYGEMRGQYEGVEDIILMDINRMVSQHKSIKIGKLDKKYVTQMPVGVRIILNWNQMDTDIDLHVIEPTGEECYYAHRDTQAGARFSKDFTQGYGPEQYLLRNAVKGKYTIKTNYFGESTLTENGPATVMVEIYITKNGVTERTLQTIQLGKVKENQSLAEITVI